MRYRRRAIGAIAILSLASVLLGFVSQVRGDDVRSRTPERPLLVYIGTYTTSEDQGIFIFRMDPASGALTRVGVAAGVANPSFLAIHPGGRYLYAVNEVGGYEGKKSGAVSAFAIDEETGELTLLNRQASGGSSPCHIVVDSSGRNALVANYGGGSVAVLRIGKDGRLGDRSSFVQHEGSSVNPRRQKGPHAHSINVDAGNRFAFAADLGLDKVLVYRFDAEKGTLTRHGAAAVKPGAGPRHFAIGPGGRFAYVINELASTVTAFSFDAERGRLRELQTVSTLPAGVDRPNSTAEVQVAPSGKFLYGSNRGHDSIVVFSIDAEKGTLKYVENESTRGKTPRNFGIDPTGKFLLAANQGTDNVVVFRIDGETGALTPAGHEARVPRPVCVKFLAR
ncbi:MAG: lactonase family protein [Planctomycetota bacterium]|nr:lactonase family protein [Planctomycetota bacterium]